MMRKIVLSDIKTIGSFSGQSAVNSELCAEERELAIGNLLLALEDGYFGLLSMTSYDMLIKKLRVKSVLIGQQEIAGDQLMVFMKYFAKAVGDHFSL